MPTYEYKCEKCEYTFEQFQSITAKPLRRCPKCGANSLNRLIGTGTGVIFKGSGFYQTDYRSESYKKQQQAEKTVHTEKKAETKTADAKTPARKQK